MAGRVTNAQDCDDTTATIGLPYPWYRDADGDSYGTSTDSVLSCGPEVGRITNATDCDDGQSASHPGATDTCGDGIDQNCDRVGDDTGDDEDSDGVIASLESTDGANDCVADDDGDGLLVEGRGDVDRDGILDYLDSYFDLRGTKVVSHWNGIYAKHPTEAWTVLHPEPTAHIITGVGGAGMTLSFGVTDRVVREVLGG
jgi:hypothetical protein